MNKLKVLITILLVCCLPISLLLTGCQAEQEEVVEEEQVPSHYSTYTDESNLFSISYPPDWYPSLSAIEELETYTKELVNSIDSNIPVEKASIIFMAGVPVEGGYMPNVNIVVEPLPVGVSNLNGYAEANIQGMKEFIEDFQMYSRVDTTVGGRRAVILETGGVFPQLGEYHNMMMITIVGKSGWVTTCTPALEDYGKYKSDLNHIVRSVRINK